MTSPRVLVTGASGYIGRHVVDRLRHEQWDVVASGVRSPIVDRQADLTDADACADLVGSTAPDVIVHLAGGPRANTADTYAINVICAVNVFTSASRQPAPPRIISMGSAAEYGAAGGGRPDETVAADPQSDYGRAKLAQTELAKWFRANRSMDVTTLRPFNVFGPSMERSTALGNLAAQLIDPGDNQLVMGRTDVVRDWVPVSLVAAAITRAVTEPPPHDVVNVCTGSGIALADIVAAALEVSNRSKPITVAPDLAAIPAQNAVVGSAERFTSWFGAIPEVTARSIATTILDRTSPTA